MAIATLLRNLQSSIDSPISITLLKRLFITSHISPPLNVITPSLNPTKLPLIPTQISLIRSFTSSNAKPTSSKVNTKVNFTPPNSPDPEPKPETIDLPPPYDPFNEKPVTQEPEDPKNLQEVFHTMRTEGLINNAVKMFDEMSKDGLTHEALELFREIKDKGKMPDVVAYSAVIEAYANAGQSKDAHKVYKRMLSSGVAPNAYTYSVLIKSLVSSGDWKMIGEVNKYVLEMLGKGMRVNTGTFVSVFEAFSKAGKVEEGRKLLEEMKGKGFVVDDKGVNEVLKGKRGPHVSKLKDILFKKK